MPNSIASSLHIHNNSEDRKADVFCYWSSSVGLKDDEIPLGQASKLQCLFSTQDHPRPSRTALIIVPTASEVCFPESHHRHRVHGTVMKVVDEASSGPPATQTLRDAAAATVSVAEDSLAWDETGTVIASTMTPASSQPAKR